jgi:hypothetical protein
MNESLAALTSSAELLSRYTHSLASLRGESVYQTRIELMTQRKISEEIAIEHY